MLRWGSNRVGEKRLAVCGVGGILAHFDRRRVEERRRVIGGAIGEDLDVDPVAAEDFDDDGRANLASVRAFGQDVHHGLTKPRDPLGVKTSKRELVLLYHFTGVGINYELALVLHVAAAGVLGGVCAVVGGVAGVETAGVTGD